MENIEHLVGTEFEILARECGRTMAHPYGYIRTMQALNDAYGRIKKLEKYAEKAAGVFVGIKINGDYPEMSEKMLAEFRQLGGDIMELT